MARYLVCVYTALSMRTRLQCGRPAMKGSKTQKYNFHGGKSTGPRTAEGRQRISKAHLIIAWFLHNTVMMSSGPSL